MVACGWKSNRNSKQNKISKWEETVHEILCNGG